MKIIVFFLIGCVKLI